MTLLTAVCKANGTSSGKPFLYGFSRGHVNEPGGNNRCANWPSSGKPQEDGGFADGGRSAVTHYRVMERFAGYTFLRVQLEQPYT
jgi:23S rRNA-/tRNA-specific pseudouridylate synthase